MNETPRSEQCEQDGVQVITVVYAGEKHEILQRRVAAASRARERASVHHIPPPVFSWCSVKKSQNNILIFLLFKLFKLWYIYSLPGCAHGVQNLFSKVSFSFKTMKLIIQANYGKNNFFYDCSEQNSRCYVRLCDHSFFLNLTNRSLENYHLFSHEHFKFHFCK